MVAIGQRDAGIGGAGAGRRDARHHLERDAMRFERLQLFGAATEDEGIAASYNFV